MINKYKGFTLIELLIVVAVIGILASIVVVSLSDQTATSQDAATKLSVSSLRTPAVAATLDGTTTPATRVCDKLLKSASSDKISGQWIEGNACGTGDIDDDTVDGTICCASDNEKWVVYGKLSKYQDATTNDSKDEDLYCADHEGNFKEVDNTDIDVTSDFNCE